MRRIKKNTCRTNRVFFVITSFILLIFPLLFITIMNENYISDDITNSKSEEIIEDTPKTSALVGWINLTNNLVNNTEFTHNDTILVEGRIYIIFGGTGVPDINVSVSINGVIDNYFNDTTDADGNFSILYRIPYSMSIFSSHKIQVNITSDTGGDTYAPINHYMIDVNTTSEFKIDYVNSDDISNPLMPGEIFHIQGNLERGDGVGIPSKQIFKTWSNGSISWDNGSYFTIVNGGFSEDLYIPVNITTDNATMKWNYTNVAGQYENSNLTLFFKVFKNVTCIWNIVDNIAETQSITIRGRIVSQTNQSMGISGRQLTVYYNGNPILTPWTDSNGNFSVEYQVPFGQGTIPIQIGVYDAYNNWTIQSEVEHNITVSAAPAQTGDVAPPAEPAIPFGDFLIILIPIIAVVGGVIAVLGYFFLKKQDQESMSVKVPLERRIRNLKILKDTGRLEEALSYLFNVIYMDLINAKFGRTKTLSETIRDFAIVSVKELKLNPTTIYPFIQKVEEIIYARPYSITERDFYDACGLFSPIYLQLTGHNFVLNF